MREPLKDKLILVADDEEDMRDIIATEFELEKCKTLGAGSGREAFEIIRNNPVDAIITDIHMPNGDGVDLLEQVKKRNPTAPIVILMTGFSNLRDQDAYDKGADALMEKPLDRKGLVSLVKRALIPMAVRWNAEGKSPISRSKFELDVQSRTGEQSDEDVKLGRGGIFLRCLKSNMPKKGETVSFRNSSRIAGLPLIEGHGVVRWVRPENTKGLPSGCGIEFLALSDACRDRVIEEIEGMRNATYIPIV